MNKHEEYKDDLLSQYMSPDYTESAPEGFTPKIMNRIRLEKAPVVVTEKFLKRNLVPIISVVVILVLIIAEILVSGNESDPAVLTFLGLLKNIRSSMPEPDLSSLFKISLPSVLTYVFIGMLALVFFDRALYRIFHREK
jgi:hypothetical protein